MSGHPAWQELLNEIPESLRPIVEPVLKKWDQGVQQTLEAKTQELKALEPYKQFVDNQVPADWLAEAADFAYRFEQDPNAVMAQANQAFNLGYQTPEEVALSLSQSSNDPELDDEMPADITQHPQFAELAKKIDGLTEMANQQQERTDNEQAQREFDSYMDKLHEEHGNFDDNYVTALIAQGMDGDKALESWNNLVAGLLNKDDEQEQAGQGGITPDGAPVVMGGDGAGAGLPTQPVSFGTMKDNDIQDFVEQYLKNSDNSDEG